MECIRYKGQTCSDGNYWLDQLKESPEHNKEVTWLDLSDDKTQDNWIWAGRFNEYLKENYDLTREQYFSICLFNKGKDYLPKCECGESCHILSGRKPIFTQYCSLDCSNHYNRIEQWKDPEYREAQESPWMRFRSSVNASYYSELGRWEEDTLRCIYLCKFPDFIKIGVTHSEPGYRQKGIYDENGIEFEEWNSFLGPNKTIAKLEQDIKNANFENLYSYEGAGWTEKFQVELYDSILNQLLNNKSITKV